MAMGTPNRSGVTIHSFLGLLLMSTNKRPLSGCANVRNDYGADIWGVADRG